MAVLSDRYARAFAYAFDLHREQVRKGSGIPYVTHLIAVSGLVLEYGGSEDEAIAGLLHDAVEDQGGASTLAEIRQRFGDEVAAIVDGCSDTDVIPKPAWRKRKEAYVAHVATASSSVRLVSAADKVHNARTIVADYRLQGKKLWSCFKGGREGTLWNYRALVEAYRSAASDPNQEALVDELERLIGEIEKLPAGDR
jgi:(p)ppGpp synthase/HD superfamily hydrolase